LLPGLCPGPPWGSLQRSPDPVVAFKAAGRGKRGKREEAGRRREEGKGRDPPPPQKKCAGSAS